MLDILITGSRLPIVAGMATMPTRGKTAPLAIASLVDQVDRLWLFLDRFDTIPDYADHPNIRVLRSQDHGDLRANAKFLGLAFEERGCFFLSADDDIKYPADYAQRLRSASRRHRHKKIVGVHSVQVRRKEFDSILDAWRVTNRADAVPKAREASLLGTDTVGFANSLLSFDVRHWTTRNMVDLTFAFEAKRRGLSFLSIARQAAWIESLEEMQSDSIFAALKKDDTRQTELARALLNEGPGDTETALEVCGRPIIR